MHGAVRKAAQVQQRRAEAARTAAEKPKDEHVAARPAAAAARSPPRPKKQQLAPRPNNDENDGGNALPLARPFAKPKRAAEEGKRAKDAPRRAVLGQKQ